MEAEKQLGKLVYPARPASQGEGGSPQCEASRLCAEMDSDEKGALSW